MKNSLLFVFLLLPTVVFTQTDTSYIEKLSDKNILGVHSTLRQFRLAFNAANQSPFLFENYNLSVGLRVKYKKVGLSFSVPVANLGTEDAGESKAYGLGFGIFPKAFFVQGDLRYIQGLAAQQENTFRDDINVMYANVYAAYLLQSDRLSLRSAFNMIDLQRRSAGSWVLSSILEYQRFTTDSLTLFTREGQFQVKRYNSYKLGLGGGYAQTIVKGKWSATAMLSGGVEFRRLNYQSAVAADIVDRLRLSPRLRLFSSVLYNENRFFYGLNGNYLPRLEVAEELNTRITDWMIRMSVGWRFY